MHACWNKLSKPKEQGGPIIRRVQDINKAAGVKLVWKKCGTSNSIWSKWVRKQYAKDGNFWKASISLLDSGIWKFMVGNISLAKNIYEKNHCKWSKNLHMV